MSVDELERRKRPKPRRSATSETGARSDLPEHRGEKTKLRLPKIGKIRDVRKGIWIAAGLATGLAAGGYGASEYHFRSSGNAPRSPGVTDTINPGGSDGKSQPETPKPAPPEIELKESLTISAQFREEKGKVILVLPLQVNVDTTTNKYPIQFEQIYASHSGIFLRATGHLVVQYKGSKELRYLVIGEIPVEIGGTETRDIQATLIE